MRAPRRIRRSLVALVTIVAMIGVHPVLAAEQPTPELAPATFTHPGVGVSRAQLDFVRSRVRAGAQPWAAANSQMMSSAYASLSRTPRPRAVVECGSYSNPNIGCTDERQDAIAAYTLALAWYITQDARYANKAIQIMDAWSGVIRDHTNSNAPLQTGWAGSSWPKAAEIIRYTYSGWSATGINRFSTMLRNVYLPEIINGSHSNGNWELTMMEAAIGIAVFLEDRSAYDRAVAKFRGRVPAFIYLTSDGAYPKGAPGSGLDTRAEIVRYWHNQNTFVNGLSQETCRDFTHTGYGLESIANFAETSRIQGQDLYPEVQERLRHALGFHARYQLGEAPPSWLCGGTVRRGLGPVFEVGFNALHTRLGIAMANTQRYVEQNRPAGTNSLFVAWTTLTHAGNAASVAAGGGAAAHPPYPDPSLPVPTRVSRLMAQMTLDEKIAQMTQAERASVTNADITSFSLGSVLSGGGSAPSPNNATSWANMYDGYQNAAVASRLGIPLIYGVDAVHGHNNVVGATIFPHNIGLGATRNPALVQQIGRATAEEVSGTGIDWDFAPCLCVARNDRWGRTYESFGEKPELPAQMASLVAGLQGSSLSAPGSVLATAKHFIGDGGTTNGTDQGNTQLSEADLRAIHLPPFREAVARGVGSVMITYSSWNSAKVHGSRFLITDLLKNELGFTGFVVSDYNGIDQIDGQPGFTAAEVRQTINAGMDMVMVPTAWRQFMTLLRAEVQAGRVPMSRIDDANRRILTKKFELGLFERPLTDRSYTGTVGSAAHRAVARQAVRESQVLLKNAGTVLPLAKTGNRIFVAGKNADNIGHQSGGWTISWQGGSGNITPGTTILQGIRNAAGAGTTVTYNQSGAGIDSSYRVAVAVVGETPYTEGAGDRPGGLGLDSADLATINTLRNAGVPVVVVLVSGRPLDIAAQLPNWNALLAAWLPGTEGAGVADVLFGDYAPTGKLPSTWMQSAGQQPINDGDGKPALFPYGFGLGYGPAPGRSAYDVTQAESFDSQSGVQTQATTDTGGGQNVGWIAPGDWIGWANLDFGTPSAVTVTTRLASGAGSGSVVYRLDSPTGPVIATTPVTSTGGWQNWTSVTTTLSGAATGRHTVYATFSGGGGDFVNLNWFRFAR